MHCLVSASLTCFGLVCIRGRAKHYSQHDRAASWAQSCAVALAGLVCLPPSLTFNMVFPVFLPLWPLHILFPDCLWLSLTLSCELSTRPAGTGKHPSPGALIFYLWDGNIQWACVEPSYFIYVFLYRFLFVRFVWKFLTDPCYPCGRNV